MRTTENCAAVVSRVKGALARSVGNVSSTCHCDAYNGPNFDDCGFTTKGITRREKQKNGGEYADRAGQETAKFEVGQQDQRGQDSCWHKSRARGQPDKKNNADPKSLRKAINAMCFQCFG